MITKTFSKSSLILTMVTSLFAGALSSSLQAGIVINIFEEGGYIKTEYAGYIDLPSGVSLSDPVTSSANTGSFACGWGYRSYGPEVVNNDSLDLWNVFTGGDSNFGTCGSETLATGAGQVSGDPLGIGSASSIYLPEDYVSGTFISGAWTANNPITTTGDLRSLNVGNGNTSSTDGGSFVRTFGSGGDGQSLTVNVTYGSNRPALPSSGEQLDNVVTGSSGGGVVFGGIISEDGLTVPNAPSVVVNSGMLDSPAYYSRLEERHFGMTYSTGSQIPLSFAMGVGTGGEYWHRNTSVVASQIDNDRAQVEAELGALSGGATSTGFTVTRTAGTSGRGPGTLQAVGELVFPEGTVEVTHTYEVVENTNYVKATSSVRAVSGTVPNVNMWVGTSDDWVGTTDSPTSSLGLVTGVGDNATFAAKCNGATNAVLVQSDAEFLMLYSPDVAFAQALLSQEINYFDSLMNVAPDDLEDWFYEAEWVEGQPPFAANLSMVDQDPRASAYGIEINDGAHALAISYGDVGATPVSRTWYYQAGILPDVPFDACPNPQKQLYGGFVEGPESIPTNSFGGLLILMTLIMGVMLVVGRGRML